MYFILQLLRWIPSASALPLRKTFPVGFQSFGSWNNTQDRSSKFIIFSMITHFQHDYLGQRCVPNAKYCLLEEKNLALNSLLQTPANMSGECTILLLHNMVEPQWVSVDCKARILPHIACANERTVSGSSWEFSHIATWRLFSGMPHSSVHDKENYCGPQETLLRYKDQHFCFLFTWFKVARTKTFSKHLKCLESSSNFTTYFQNALKIAVLASNIKKFKFSVGNQNFTIEREILRKYFNLHPEESSHNWTVHQMKLRYVCVSEPSKTLDLALVLISKSFKLLLPIFSTVYADIPCSLDMMRQEPHWRLRSLKKCFKRRFKQTETSDLAFHSKEICFLTNNESYILNNNKTVTCSCNKNDAIGMLFFINRTTQKCDSYTVSPIKNQYAFKFNCLLDANYFPCEAGQPNCFHVRDICKFRLSSDAHIVPCHTGAHLQECKEYFCTAVFFKCELSHCVPWSYLNDGKWDCPYGDDEITFENTSLSCFAKLRCDTQLSSFRCVHISSICDRYKDCPNGDDEQLCTLKEVICPTECYCLNLAILCVNMRNLEVFIERSLNMFVAYSVVNGQVEHFNDFSLDQVKSGMSGDGVKIMNFSHNKISCVCDFKSTSLSNLIVLDLSFNNITTIGSFCFNGGLNNFHQLFLNNNSISIVESFAFIDLHSLSTLSLQNNSITTLKIHSFHTLPNLHTIYLDNNEISIISKHFMHITTKLDVISLRGNLLDQIDPEMFLDVVVNKIFTDLASVCCVAPPAASCSASVKWYQSCTALIPTTASKTIAYVVSVFVVILNFSSFVILRRKVKKQTHQRTGTSRGPYNIMVNIVNLTDFCQGVYLATVSLADVHYWSSFVVYDVEWMNSYTCASASCLMFLISFLGPMMLTLMSLGRVMVVKYPFESKFKSTKHVVRYVVTLVLCGVLIPGSVSIILVSLFGVASPLCLPFVNPTKSRLHTQVSSIVVLFWEVMCFLTILLLNVQLSLALKQSEEQAKRKRLTWKVVAQMTTFTFANFISWICSGAVFIVTLFLERYPPELVLWVTITCVPLTALLNPIVFLTIRKQ